MPLQKVGVECDGDTVGKDLKTPCPSSVAESCANLRVIPRRWDLVEVIATLCA